MADGYFQTNSNGFNTITTPNTGSTTGAGHTYFTYPVVSNYGWYYPVVVPEADKEVVKEEGKGCHCIKCRDFNEYAEANQEDGTFICFACRKGLK